MKAPSTSDDSYAVLHQLGWSCGDTAFRDGATLVWQVYAHRGEQSILVRAMTPREAWRLAAEQAVGLNG